MKNICFLLVFLSIAALGFSQGSNCCIPVVEKNGTSSVVGLANVRLVIKTGTSTSRILQNENLEALDVLLSLDSVVSLSSGGLIKFTDFADKIEKAINKSFVDKIIPTSGGKAIIITKAFRNTFKTDESYASMAALAIECITQGSGGASVAYDALTSGTVTAQVTRIGGTATTLTNPAAGEYNLNIQSGADFQMASIFGNNTTLNGSNEMIIRVNNAANSRDRRVFVQLYDAQNGALVDQQVTATVHTQAVSGNVTTITIPGLNGFGATGFYVEIR